MSEPFQEPVAPSNYGRQRHEAWLAHHQANADMATRAALQAHGQGEDHRVVQSGQQGLYPGMSPTDMGAAVAAQQATVGADYGGRPLQRSGGTFDPADYASAPAPARADMRYVNQPSGPPTGESPLLAHMRGRQQ